jgi:hypothetical protein
MGMNTSPFTSGHKVGNSLGPINTSLAGARSMTHDYRKDICHTFQNLNSFQFRWFASRMNRIEDHFVEKSRSSAMRAAHSRKIPNMYCFSTATAAVLSTDAHCHRCAAALLLIRPDHFIQSYVGEWWVVRAGLTPKASESSDAVEDRN